MKDMIFGRIVERFWDERRAAARLIVPPNLIPAPGQYLLAYDPDSDDPIAVALFPAGISPEGLLVAPPLPSAWFPGRLLALRGPLGHGFSLPPGARRVALAAVDLSPAYLLGLLPQAFEQGAAVCLLCQDPPVDLPTEVEIRPLATLEEVCHWADYLALAISRAGWYAQRTALFQSGLALPEWVQVLIRTAMPCAALASCGVCAVEMLPDRPALVCEEGPVFAVKA